MAREQIEAVREVAERLEGIDSEQALESRLLLAWLELRDGHHDTAERQLIHLAAVCKEVLGPDTPLTGFAVHQLGLIRLQERKFARARELFDESLALDQQAGART